MLTKIFLLTGLLGMLGCIEYGETPVSLWNSSRFEIANLKDDTYGADLPKLQAACSKHIERLRTQAQRDANLREARRLGMGISSLTAEAVGGVTALSAATARDAQAISGYVVLGAGLVVKSIDLALPQGMADESYAAWRQARTLGRRASDRLVLLSSCMTTVPVPGEPLPALPPAELADKCKHLLDEIKVDRGAGSLASGDELADEIRKNRLRFTQLLGAWVLTSVREALNACVEVEVKRK